MGVLDQHKLWNSRNKQASKFDPNEIPYYGL
jgi:hypothetical protein